jgi:hypothetical protein
VADGTDPGGFAFAGLGMGSGGSVPDFAGALAAALHGVDWQCSQLGQAGASEQLSADCGLVPNRAGVWEFYVQVVIQGGVFSTHE